MTSDLSLLKMNKFVLGKQRLTGEKVEEDLVETVRAIGGLHATIPATPYLSLFARVEDFRREQLDKALYVTRSLGKIRYVRTTVHVLPTDFVPTALTATRTLTELVSQGYAQFLGITQEQYAETSRKIMKILTGKNGMTTKQIKQQLQTTLNVSPIVNLMCDQGLLIRGAPEKGWKSNIHTYFLLNGYLPGLKLNTMGEEDAKKAVIRQYLASFGPATENDVSWWSGFTKGQIRPIIEESSNELTNATVSGIDKTFIMLSQDEKAIVSGKATGKHVVNMLPTLDPYLMGYKDRERFLDLARFDYVYDRSGNAVATILFDGKIIGVWDFKEPIIKIFLFSNVEADTMKKVEEKARSLGTFISGKEVKVKEYDSMIPLTQRTAGGFMSPLK
jgi:hypothetical protein